MSASDHENRQSAEHLCQNQVENLVKAMESIENDSSTSTTTSCAPGNFTTEVDSELIDAARQFHQSIAQKLSTALNAVLRTAVQVRVDDVMATNLKSFQLQAKDHRWFSVLSPEKTLADWHFDIAPELCCVMVDRMLGGDPTEGETFTRPMTEIELRLMGRVADAALDQIQQSWSELAGVHWIVTHNQNPSAAAKGNDDMVVVRMSVSLCANQGTMRLCIPLETIQQHRAQLCDSRRASGSDAGIPRSVAGAHIDVVANVAHSTIRTADLLDLGVGDIIATEWSVDEPLELTIHQLPKFKIRAGSLKGNKAVQIESTVDARDGHATRMLGGEDLEE